MNIVNFYYKSSLASRAGLLFPINSFPTVLVLQRLIGIVVFVNYFHVVSLVQHPRGRVDCPLVVPQVAVLGERLLADLALERPLPVVQSEVVDYVRRLFESFAAIWKAAPVERVEFVGLGVQEFDDFVPVTRYVLELVQLQIGGLVFILGRVQLLKLIFEVYICKIKSLGTLGENVFFYLLFIKLEVKYRTGLVQKWHLVYLLKKWYRQFCISLKMMRISLVKWIEKVHELF